MLDITEPTGRSAALETEDKEAPPWHILRLVSTLRAAMRRAKCPLPRLVEGDRRASLFADQPAKHAPSWHCQSNPT